MHRKSAKIVIIVATVVVPLVALNYFASRPSPEMEQLLEVEKSLNMPRTFSSRVEIDAGEYKGHFGNTMHKRQISYFYTGDSKGEARVMVDFFGDAGWREAHTVTRAKAPAGDVWWFQDTNTGFCSVISLNNGSARNPAEVELHHPDSDECRSSLFR